MSDVSDLVGAWYWVEYLNDSFKGKKLVTYYHWYLPWYSLGKKNPKINFINRLEALIKKKVKTLKKLKKQL